MTDTDRDPLVHELSMEDYMAAAVGLHGRTPGYYGNLANAAKNWLTAHGWGPKPTVDAQLINNCVTAALVACDLNPLLGYLRECGIEVDQ